MIRNCISQRFWLFSLSLCCSLLAIFFSVFESSAQNISTFKDVLSNSAPDTGSNHTFFFTVNETIPPGGLIEISFPESFVVVNDSTFSPNRNVQLFVNGAPRLVSDTLSTVSDRVEILSGSPGSIRYTLNTTSNILAGRRLELRVGNHTTLAQSAFESYDELLEATTTSPGDVEPIINPVTTGTHSIPVRLYNASAGQLGYARFLVATIRPVTQGADTTETDPPERFNGSPEGVISGLATFIEVSLETNEFAICRYSQNPNVPFPSMTSTFSNTGLIFHSTLIPAVPSASTTVYVRCIDDEFNFNIDDYLITFFVQSVPTGQANTDGETSGDGTGTGDDGSGDGSGSGGTTGDSDGEADTVGGSSGGGGVGGGSGGGTGGGGGGGGGGGFESELGPFESGDGRVIINGTAPVSSRLFVLIDGQERGNVQVNNRGVYEITIDGINRGTYTFGIYAIDSNNVRTSTFSTSFTVRGARATALSNIHIPPSVRVVPDPVDPGQVATISGVSVPGAQITIENERADGGSKQTFTAVANALGVWSIPVDTTGFRIGTYRVRARAQADGVTTNFSNYLNYGVGERATGVLNADLNRDGRVNLTDFSILLFWWGTDGGVSNPPADINQDGRVNLTDFSILLFNWTG